MVQFLTPLLFAPFLLVWLLTHPWRYTEEVVRYRVDGHPDLRYLPRRVPIWSSSILGFLFMSCPKVFVAFATYAVGATVRAYKSCRTAWRKHEDEKLLRACRAKWVASGAPYR